MRFEKKKALITVRTYPIPASPGVEVSCTAAITDEGKWLRLFPVPYRFLDQDKKFRKYQWIEFSGIKASDPRPESYHIDIDSINILSEPLPTTNEWRARKDMVFPLRAPSLCYLKNERDLNKYPTLGFFRPKTIDRLRVITTSPTWSQAELNMLRQDDLFRSRPLDELEKIPYHFSYTFRCDAPACTSHSLLCTDWEMGQAWRKWSREYGDEWEAKFRQRFETEMIQKNDTHFYVGTTHRHPHVWIIIGLFYPPKMVCPSLFD